MRSVKVSQSIHRILIFLPIGLLSAAVVFDLVDLATGTGAFSVAAYWMFAGGVFGGLLAALFGLADWVHIPAGTRARHIGALHGGGNVLVLLLCAGSWLLRDAQGSVPAAALALSFTSAIVSVVTVWLGNVLVSSPRAGLHDAVGADGLSSLSLDEHPGTSVRMR